MDSLPPFHHLDKLASHEETSASGLSHCDQLSQFFISHLLQSTQQTSFEEHLNIRNRIIDNNLSYTFLQTTK